MSGADWLAAARHDGGETSPGVAVRWPFYGDSIALTRWRCQEHDPRPRGEKHQRWHVIAFLGDGSFRMRDRTGVAVADSTRLVFYSPWSGYETSHPCGCGDHGGSLVLREDLARTLLAAAGDRRAPDDPRPRFPRNVVALDPRLQGALWSLLRAAERGGDELAIEEEAIGLAERAVRSGVDAPPPRARPAATRARRERVMRVQELLYQRMEERVRLAELAAAVDVSVFRLCREFRAETGFPMHRYLTCLRLGRGAELIATGAAGDLSALAHDLGFSSHSHFTSAFRAAYGASPSLLRRAAVAAAP
jgi:AraC-like DNA-binding protein